MKLPITAIVSLTIAGPLCAQGGDCTAFVRAGTLVVEGDNDDNSILITEPVSGTFEVQGIGGTLVNGGASASFGGVTNVRLDMRGGEDLCEIDGTEIPGCLTFDGGEGPNEFVLVDSDVGEDLDISNKDGGSVTEIEETCVGGDVSIDNKTGLDEIEFKETEVSGDVYINNHDGDEQTGEGSEVQIEDESLLLGDCTIVNRSGFDEVSVSELSMVVGSLWIDNGDGDPLTGDGSGTEVQEDSIIGGDLVVINRDGFDEVDFEDGAQIDGNVWIVNQSGGSGVDIENSVLNGSLSVDARDGFDELNLDDTDIAGGFQYTPGAGGSDVETESTSGLAGVNVGGDFVIEIRGSGVDSILLGVLDVGGSTAILTGPRDDTVEVVDSSFAQAFFADGHAGFDVFTRVNSTFGSLDLTRFEQIN